ncbi:MAG: coproporphyrinogen III oxidase, partial [Deltaproteobacteria bacterium]|nr:coproporphyrinogen III oxidase [Deltaproteobacteria bacterium]
GAAFEKHTWDFVNGAGSVEVNVCRGDFFEKVCISNISATVTIPDRDHESSIQWLGIQTFPSNPLVPMFMGVFENVEEQGLEHKPAFFDVYPIIGFDEDKQYLQEQIGAVCSAHGRAYPDLPDSYLEMFRLKQAGIGVGYAAGLSLMPSEDNSQYFQEAALAILDAYVALLKKRKGSSATDRQSAAMDSFRTDWTRFTFMDNRFFQGGIQLGVPPEAFLLHMLPPVVKF